MCVHALSCLTLGNPRGCSPADSSIHGILQARILEWVAIPFSRGYSRPRDGTQVSCTAGRFCSVWGTREARPVIYVYANTRMYLLPLLPPSHPSRSSQSITWAPCGIEQLPTSSLSMSICVLLNDDGVCLLLANFLVTESLFRRAVHVSRSGQSVPTKFQQDDLFFLFSFVPFSLCPFRSPSTAHGISASPN